MSAKLFDFVDLGSRLKLARRRARTATEIYGRLVTFARTHAYYSRLGVPDTPEGRLEMVLAHVVLVLLRLGREAKAEQQLARAIAERFVTDVDDCMREMGVSDIKVPQQVKKAAAALYDRMHEYSTGLAADDHSVLARSLARHVFAASPDAQVPAAALQLAKLMRAHYTALLALDVAMLRSANFELPGPDATEAST
jgi:cytochrome b pre-mRNA-processing protein 3